MKLARRGNIPLLILLLSTSSTHIKQRRLHHGPNGASDQDL